MKKLELKKVLKPLIKECIKEALLEEGLLSNVISEVVKGLGATRQPIVEQKQNDDEIGKLQLEQKQKRSREMNEVRKKMLNAIGQSSYNGVDLFEGTTPMSKAGSPGSALTPQDPLSGIDPRDQGVDISAFTTNKNVWKALVGGK
tara:strand:- start:549 stop:983 length:435 start_codon:yes stop_codon:yes gene_type:complete